MVVEWVLGALAAVLGAVASLIPDVPIPFEDELADAGTFVGSRLGGLNTFLPIEEWATAVTWGFAFYIPFVVGWVIVRWAFGHVPWIGGK